MVRLGEEIPALGEEARVLHDERGGEQRRADSRAAGEQQRRHREHQREEAPSAPRARTSRDRPWKNSRVLNEPPMKPCAFCTMRGCLTPIAVCSVDLGRSRALRASEASARRGRRARRDERAHRRRRPRERRRGQRRERGGQRETRGAAEQEEVERRERRVPLLQELEAGVDHPGADEEREAQRSTDGAPRPSASAPLRPARTGAPTP